MGSPLDTPHSIDQRHAGGRSADRGASSADKEVGVWTGNA
jgi:hypothetical protein